jgi:hypothetical protein
MPWRSEIGASEGEDECRPISQMWVSTPSSVLIPGRHLMADSEKNQFLVFLARQWYSMPQNGVDSVRATMKSWPT